MSEPRRITEHYRLDKLVASSDSGSVFRATELVTGARVAVKLIDIDERSTEQREAFQNTAAALRSLRHPGIPRTLDFGFTTGGSAFLVSEYIRGASLELLIGAGSAQVLRLALLVTAALEELSAHGIAYHNLRLDNVLLVPGTNEDGIMLLGLCSSASLLGGGSSGGEPSSGDLRSLAIAVCKLLDIPSGVEPTASVELPPGSAVLADPEALRSWLASCLSPEPSFAGPGKRTSLSFEAARVAFVRALGIAPAADGAATAADRLEMTVQVPAEAAGTRDLWPPGSRDRRDRRDQRARRETAERLEMTLQVPAPEVALETLPAYWPPQAAQLAAPASADRSAAATAPLPRQAVSLPAPPAAAEVARPHRLQVVAEPPSPGPGSRTDEQGEHENRAETARLRSGFARWLLPLGAAAALTALASGAVFLGRAPRERAQKAPAAKTLAALAAMPRSSPAAPIAQVSPPVPSNPQIHLAEVDFARGDLADARKTLAGIPAERVAALSQAERGRYDQVASAVARASREQIAREVSDGLTTGSLGRLSAALTLSREIRELPAEMNGDLDRARRALAAAVRLSRAQRSHNQAEILAAAAELQTELPANAAAGQAREQAAAALEAQADAAVDAGEPDRALTVLEAIRRTWPDRPQLGERTERAGARRQADAKLDAVLAAAAHAEQENQPLQGLDLLAGTNPSSRYAERFRLERERLEGLLARLDSAAPKVVLTEAFRPEYEKGKSTVVQLRVTDDFQVKNVNCWARAEGGSYQEIPVRHGDGADYAVDIPESLLQNKTMELYVTASDLSGHQGSLGSRTQPIRLKRKSWLSKIFTGKNGERR